MSVEGYPNLVPWKKGQSGNARGRPKGFVLDVQKVVGPKGKILIDFFVSVMQEEMVQGIRPTLFEKMKAAQWLTERAFGSIERNLDLQVEDDFQPVEVDFTRLTDDELRNYRQLLFKLITGNPADSRHGDSGTGQA